MPRTLSDATRARYTRRLANLAQQIERTNVMRNEALALGHGLEVLACNEYLLLLQTLQRELTAKLANHPQQGND